MLEYVWISDNRQFSEDVRVANMSHTTHSVSALYKLISTYWEMGVFRTLSKSKLECFRKNSYRFKLFLQNSPSENFERVLNMYQVLNISRFWIVQNYQYARVLNLQDYTGFTYFRKYDRILNMRRDAVMEEFWIYYDSEYARFLHMRGLYKVLSMLENASINCSDYVRVLNMSLFIYLFIYFICQFVYSWRVSKIQTKMLKLQ